MLPTQCTPFFFSRVVGEVQRQREATFVLLRSSQRSRLIRDFSRGYEEQGKETCVCIMRIFHARDSKTRNDEAAEDASVKKVPFRRPSDVPVATVHETERARWKGRVYERYAGGSGTRPSSRRIAPCAPLSGSSTGRDLYANGASGVGS